MNNAEFSSKNQTVAMPASGGSRPGGRAARIQSGVLEAVEALKKEMPTAAITVPMIAARAKVTPSTIYRRWGGVVPLLADVAVRQFQAETLPPDSGNWRRDLTLWLEQFVDEMGSGPGRDLLREALALANTERAGQCTQCILSALESIIARGVEQGASPPDAQRVLDQVVAPVIYRILFTPTPPDTAYATGLLEACLAQAASQSARPTA
ncbi:TetR-like C-terminal domain-containing protein [Xanthomonas massiliensis]|uniref:TetR-like C-terminal domain-containing protein n=1 Tax=Xanthomonas massiliensis TaxID=1720302 RepID=UPI000A8D2E23|nr:TetR/AcrR family transcriptional regulator [Xanthomonas massiliensis]